jgi:hypothetical protein
MAAASADAAEPEEEEELVPTNPSRGLMYILISLHGMPNWMIRGGIFSWMPFVVRELGLSEAQRALLMGAWFPGYAFAQVPAAALIMRIGAKKVIGLNLLGTCGAYLALPFVAALGGSTAMQVRLMAACLAVAGLCQAPLVAGQKTMQRNWLPKIGSPSRPIHHKLVSLGELFGQGILANALTPWIASNFGWRAVNYAMGGGGLLCLVVWMAFAQAEPTRWKRRGDSAVIADAPAAAAAAAATVDKDTAATPAVAVARKTDWRLFRHPAVLATLWCKVAEGNFFYVTGQWTPTYFIEQLGCTPMQTATYMAWFMPIQFTSGFIAAAVEGALLKSGVPLITIRKSAQALCATWRTVALIVFGMVKTPRAAAIAINIEALGQCLHHSGYSANMIEVAGADTATLNAIGNTGAQVCGMAVPVLGVWLRQRFGSFMPLFVVSGAGQIIGAVLFSLFGRVTCPADDPDWEKEEEEDKKAD